MATTIDLSDETPTPAASSPAPEASIAAPASTGSELATTSHESLGVSGEVGMKDLIIPYLACVQKSGSKSDTHPIGAWVLGDVDAAPKGTVLSVSAWDIQKKYESVEEYGSGVMPTIFETAEEVRLAGYSFGRKAEKQAREIAGILFWVNAPEGAPEDAFPLVTDDGKRGMVAKFVARSSSYGGVAQPLFTAVSPLGHLRGKPVKLGSWLLSAKLTTGNGNSWYQLSLRPNGVTDPSVLALVDSLELV